MRRQWRWAAQAMLFLAVIFFVVHSLRQSWQQLSTTHLVIHLDPGWMTLSTLAVVLTSLIQIESWRRMLRGWGQRLKPAPAARIWFLANIGRYIPGKVWSVAGMIVMAEEAGVARWASAASAVAIQAIGLGTAVAVILGSATTTNSPLGITIAALVAVGTVATLAWEFATDRIARIIPRLEQLRPLPVPALLMAAGLTFVSWLTYGLALWWLARALGLPPTLSFRSATGAFALSYIAGLLALFAPGGVGVREGFLFGLLAPSLGPVGAVVLGLASRVQLTLVEAACGLMALALKRTPKETTLDASAP